MRRLTSRCTGRYEAKWAKCKREERRVIVSLKKGMAGGPRVMKIPAQGHKRKKKKKKKLKAIVKQETDAKD